MDGKKQYAVIGLGKFGGSVAKTLHELGHEVLGIDSSEETVQLYSNLLTHVILVDARDEDSMLTLGLHNFDAVVVAVGEDVEANLFTTLILKQFGVKKVVVMANSLLHGRMLEKIGADKVVYPDINMGQRVAHNLASSSILDFIELNDDLSVVELTAPKFTVNKTLAQTNLRAEFNVNVVALKRGADMQVPPQPHECIQEGDILILVGRNEGIKRLEALV